MTNKTRSERVLVIGMVVLGVIGLAVLTPVMAANGSSWGWIVAIDVLIVAVIWLETTRGLLRLRNERKEAADASAPPRTPKSSA